MLNIEVRTLQSPNGVLGLNGYWYLESDKGKRLKFPSEQEAIEFIQDNGGDPNNEYVEYINIEDNKSECIDNA